MYAHSHHIPQPPHSAGQSFQGLRPRIEQHQIPSPIDAIEADREQWEGQTYLTLSGTQAPLSTTDFVSVDQGNSSPRFARVSTWSVPSTSSLANECEIPLTAVFQPFADQHPQEEPIPVVQTGEIGPARCAKCRGYVNPWCTWVSGGNRWKCNLCSHESEVSPEYFCNLDVNNSRLDQLQRPELTKGTVDFVVPEAYYASHPLPRISLPYYAVEPPLTGVRRPQPMDFVVAFDVGSESLHNGFFQVACDALRKILYGSEGEEGHWPGKSRLSIITFDRTLHFYDLSSTSPQVPTLVVADIDEPFVPLRDGLFVDPIEFRTAVETLLTSLPLRHADTPIQESCLGAAMRSALATLAGRGGQVILFTCTLPTIGPGALSPSPSTSESAVVGTDKEKTLYTPQNTTWRDIGEEMAEEGIGVSLWLGMGRFIDVGSIGVVANMTGGSLYFHPRFDPAYDAPVLNSELRRLFTRTTGYNCVMRVRCGNGLRIQSHFGNFFPRTPTDLELGVLHSDAAISCSFEHASKLSEREYAYLQCATLYTSVDGERRVRCINLALQVATLAGNVYRYADMDAAITGLAREAVSNMQSRQTSHIREDLTEKCSSILLGYRKNCAASTALSQLIIPEAFRALPVYALAILKSKPLKARNVSTDVRNYFSHRMLCMPVRTLIQYLYPPLLALHDLRDEIAVPHPETGKIEWPSLMRDSHIYMEGHGVYLIDNEEIMIIWIGSSVSPQILYDLFGVDDIISLDPHMSHLPNLPTLLSTQVRNILAYRQVQRGGHIPKLFLCRQNLDGAEIEFSDMLVEDQNNAAMSYTDYLCLVHKQITHALETGGSLSGTSSLRGSPW